MLLFIRDYIIPSLYWTKQRYAQETVGLLLRMSNLPWSDVHMFSTPVVGHYCDLSIFIVNHKIFKMSDQRKNLPFISQPENSCFNWLFPDLSLMNTFPQEVEIIIKPSLLTMIELNSKCSFRSSGKLTISALFYRLPPYYQIITTPPLHPL